MIEALQKRLGYQFRSPELLTQALTHPSVHGKVNNQRLEFLGDAVLGAIVAAMVYEKYPHEKEGELARRHAALVRGETLAEAAITIGLGEALHMGLSELQINGRNNGSNLEDAMEALIGAMYLDGGLAPVKTFVETHWLALAEKALTPPKDAKTALQEWAQARSLPVPQYRILQTTGPAHAPLFTIEVTVQGYAPKEAKAASKRAAEQVAAAMLLQELPNEQ